MGLECFDFRKASSPTSLGGPIFHPVFYALNFLLFLVQKYLDSIVQRTAVALLKEQSTNTCTQVQRIIL